ncbi:MAG: exosortase/archaeosortase family protein [Verrucomicrobiales bacterium]|jgi:exosortase|nr:exosortase/archaeosortase family protein [Verrucomicrobiales bacterium]
MEISKPVLDKRTLIIALVISTLILAGLYGLFPYNFGYGLEPVSVFRNLWSLWFAKNMDDWGHCPFVPLIVVFLIWWDHKKLVTVPIENNTLIGLLGIAAAGLFFWLGYKIDITALGFLSIQVTLAALIIWFFGLKFMRAVFFPWAFLIFAWPMPFISTNILRMLMTKISTHLLNFIGMDCIQNGTAILSAPHFEVGIQAGQLFSLEVAAACSGLRSLFALMMMSALAGYLMLDKPWQRWLLFFSSVPLAVAGNVFRIVLLAFGAQLFGSPFAIGTEEHPSSFHLLAGFAVYLVALVGMFVIGWLLNGGWRPVMEYCGFKAAKKSN